MKHKTILLLSILTLISAVVFVSAQTPRNGWAQYDGNKVHYYDIGNPKAKNALIFIHGWTCNADFWKDSFGAFPKYRVIAIDLPGHGQSDKPKVDYTMEYFARSIEAVMKDAKVQRAVLVGHSMGTPVTRQFYRLYPDQTLGIVVVDGLLRPIGSLENMEKGFLGPLRANYKENQPKLVEGLTQPIKDESLKKYVRETMTAAPDYVGIGAMAGMVDPSIWRNDTIKVPVLALMAASPWWAPDTKDSFQAVAPNIDFQMWTGVSHFLFMERPKEFNEAVETFVAKNKLL